jgi:hypothetical protein
MTDYRQWNDEQRQAAVKIQAYTRGYLTRKDLKSRLYLFENSTFATNNIFLIVIIQQKF